MFGLCVHFVPTDKYSIGSQFLLTHALLLKRERTGVCEMTVKRTRLCYWIARPAKPGVQSSNTSWVFHCHFAHTRAFSLLSHTYYVQTDLRWLLFNDFDARKLMVVTYFSNSQLFLCAAESWWNMQFKGTRHGNGVADGAVAKLLRLWQHASALWRHAVWIRIVTSHNAWIGYEYSLPNVNRPSAIHKHHPHPLETMGRVW